jgi:hypothetical protein
MALALSSGHSCSEPIGRRARQVPAQADEGQAIAGGGGPLPGFYGNAKYAIASYILQSWTGRAIEPSSYFLRVESNTSKQIPVVRQRDLNANIILYL